MLLSMSNEVTWSKGAIIINDQRCSVVKFEIEMRNAPQIIVWREEYGGKSMAGRDLRFV